MALVTAPHDDLSDIYQTAREELSGVSRGPPSEHAGLEPAWGEDAFTGAGQFFDQDVDDTELPSALGTMRTFRRPRQVPVLDLSSIVDTSAHPPHLTQASLATQSRPEDEIRFLHTQLEESRSENKRLHQTVEGLKVSKEELDTEVMELWKSLNQGILRNHNLGSTIEDLRTQLHVAKSDIRALEGALQKSETERADVENRLHSANRRLDEMENDAIVSSIMAVGGEGGSLEGLPQAGETLEVEKAESVKANRSAGSSLLDAESGGVQGTTKWWRKSWVHGVAIIGIVMFAIKKL
ncbi:hypothetical protein BSKO_08053 [Bryopsis sp. KO-2023]|nr:hypothetical protein BSKO_08053 [Bryopsis sp. KO-2023]